MSKVRAIFIAIIAILMAIPAAVDADEHWKVGTVSVSPRVVPAAGSYELTVRGSDFTPNLDMAVLPCIAPGGRGELITEDDCDLDNRTRITTTADGTFVVVNTFAVTANTTIVASNADQSEVGGVILSIEPPRTETLTVTPILPGPITVGDWVTFNIHGAGFRPGSIVFLWPCKDTHSFDCERVPLEFQATDDGTFEGTHTYQITSAPFAFQAIEIVGHSFGQQAAAEIPIAPQRLNVVPYVVTAPGEHELELRGSGWAPGTELLVTPCVAPLGDRRAIEPETDCDTANPISVRTSADGLFWMRETLDVGENFALHVSNKDSTETMSTRVWIARRELCIGGAPLATIRGTRGDDTLIGTNGPDFFAGLAGNDRIIGMGGDDVICAGAGDDRVFAGSGDDMIFGEGGIDKIRGGAGDDYIDGGIHMDFLKGGDGEDEILGGDGPDRIRAGRDDDTARGGDGDDRIWGGPGNDTLFGNLGTNIVNGGAGLQDECFFDFGVDLHANCEVVLGP